MIRRFGTSRDLVSQFICQADCYEDPTSLSNDASGICILLAPAQRQLNSLLSRPVSRAPSRDVTAIRQSCHVRGDVTRQPANRCPDVRVNYGGLRWARALAQGEEERAMVLATFQVGGPGLRPWLAVKPSEEINRLLTFTLVDIFRLVSVGPLWVSEERLVYRLPRCLARVFTRDFLVFRTSHVFITLQLFRANFLQLSSSPSTGNRKTKQIILLLPCWAYSPDLDHVTISPALIGRFSSSQLVYWAAGWSLFEFVFNVMVKNIITIAAFRFF